MNYPNEQKFAFLISEATKQGNYQKAHDLKVAADIYKISKNLDIYDWQKIRTIQFWQASDKLKDDEKQNFLLKTLKQYAANKKKFKSK